MTPEAENDRKSDKQEQVEKKKVDQPNDEASPETEEEELDKALEDSFPASDPPAMTETSIPGSKTEDEKDK